MFALARRVANDLGMDPRELDLESRNARGGLPRAKRELTRYVDDLLARETDMPDVLVVAVDADCVGGNARRGELRPIIDRVPSSCCIVLAIPDPHVERWYLIDAAAVKAALGQGPAAYAPRHCEREVYKRVLAETIELSGARPALGGYEFAAPIVEAMDFYAAGRAEPELGRFLEEFRACLRACLAA